VRTPHPLESLIQQTCEAIRQLPATDSSLVEMFERGKYDATLPIRVELGKVLNFLEPFPRGKGIETFSTMPQALSNSLAMELQALIQIAEEIPIKCQLQTTNVVPPSFHGSEAGVAKRVDTIHARIYSQLISFCPQLGHASEGPRSPGATPDVDVQIQESANESTPVAKRHVVITLHGIRTRAKWQKAFDEELSRSGFICVSRDYGWFSVLPFLLQRQRDQKVSWFIEEYQKITARSPGLVPSVVAHSLGTYIVARAITESAGQVKFDKIIFCGSIVPETFPWSRIIKAGLASEVLNDCAYLDLWAGTVGLALPDAGPSGRKGFHDLANGKVHQRVHSAWRHSQFFFSLNYQGRWIPFLKGQPVTDLDFKRDRHFPLLWALGVLLLFLAASGIVLYFYPNYYAASKPTTKGPTGGETSAQDTGPREQDYHFSPNLVEETAPMLPPEETSAIHLIREYEPLKVDRVQLDRCKSDNVNIVVSISKQQAYLMCNKEIVADAPISSGKGGSTPTGRFTVLRKDADQYSSVFGDFVDAQGRTKIAGVNVLGHSPPSGTHFVGASMKWFLKLTEDDLGLYEGIVPGYPASHGGIRMTSPGAELFYEHVEIGSRVDVVKDF
jgi:L,D-transpeptidase-like protein